MQCNTGSNFRDMKTGPRCGANERHIFLISKQNMRGFFWPGEWDRVVGQVFHVTKIRANIKIEKVVIYAFHIHAKGNNAQKVLSNSVFSRIRQKQLDG